jgi:hypothetical protein
MSNENPSGPMPPGQPSAVGLNQVGRADEVRSPRPGEALSAITPGTLYLTHFAGPAGAVAVLSVSENADAASLMASADATGRTTREKLVNANPFLRELTVGDLKNWANRKMRSY